MSDSPIIDKRAIIRCLQKFAYFIHLRPVLLDFFERLNSHEEQLEELAELIDKLSNPLPSHTHTFLDLRDFGWDGTRSAIVRWQDAIDQAQTYVSIDTGVPCILVPPGEGTIDQTIIWKSVPIDGGLSNVGTRVFWEGSAGIPVFQKDSSSGGVSFARMSNMSFRAFDNQPSSWIDVTNINTPLFFDALFQLPYMHFIGGITAIDAMGWVNLHLEHVRFDQQRDYCLHIRPPASQFLSSLAIRAFTVDPTWRDRTGRIRISLQAVIYVDGAMAQVNMGIIKLEDGRIEGSHEPWGTQDDGAILPSGIYLYNQQNTAQNPRTCDFTLRDLAIQATAGSLLHRVNTNPLISDRFVFDNLATSGVGEILGGQWPAFITKPVWPSEFYINRLSYEDVRR